MRYSDFKIVETKLDEIPDDGNAAGQEPNRPVDGQQNLEAGPPYPPEQVDAVKALQTKLEELGYDVGNTGVDGKYGPRTARAVAAYMRDFNVQNTNQGRSIDNSEIQAMQTREPVENPTPTGNEGAGGGSSVRFNPEDLEALNFGGVDNERAKAAAEEFLGRSISDADWNMLVRATVAEASPDQEERAAVMAVILNRVRSGSYPGTIPGVLTQTNQFQAVTGTPADRSPSRWFSNPSPQAVAGVAQAAIDHLSSSNREWLNFTSNNPRAYGAGTNINFMYAMRRSPGAEVIGGTVFGTV
jgi:N-acetylmuramoyl-L-alanine amidase